MYKIGIIGCGKIAQVRHIPEYEASGRAEIAAFYDINYERACQMAEKHGGRAYKDLDELLSADLDAVSVCTANNTHAEITIKALQKSLSVLCEKPMATTLEDCIRMNEEAEKAGKILMIGQNQRLAKAHKRAHDLISSGSIGRVLSFRTVFGHSGPETWSVDPGKNTWFFDKKRAAMGAMADLGIHKTDLICYLLDDVVDEVRAVVCTLDKRDGKGELIPVDDNAVCIYRMKKGAIGTMTASWTYYGAEDNSTVIYGEKGIMKIYADKNFSLIVERIDGSRECYELDKIQTNDSQSSSGVIDCFLDSLDRGKAEISSSSVLPAMKAVFAAIESGKSGESVKID